MRAPRDLDALVLAGGGDGAHGARGVQQRFDAEVVAVGEGRLLAGHGAHAHALVDAEAAALDDAFFQAPAFVARGLEVQVGVVDAVFADGGQRLRQAGFGQAEGLQHQGLGDGQAFDRGFAGDHGGLGMGGKGRDCRIWPRPARGGALAVRFAVLYRQFTRRASARRARWRR
jgi:hypothetical protein